MIIIMLNFSLGKKWCQNAMMCPHLVPSYLTDYHSKHRGSSVPWERDLLGTT